MRLDAAVETDYVAEQRSRDQYWQPRVDGAGAEASAPDADADPTTVPMVGVLPLLCLGVWPEDKFTVR